MAPVPLAPMMPHSAPERFDKKGDDDDWTKGGLLKVENTHTQRGWLGGLLFVFCLFRFFKDNFERFQMWSGKQKTFSWQISTFCDFLTLDTFDGCFMPDVGCFFVALVMI